MSEQNMEILVSLKSKGTLKEYFVNQIKQKIEENFKLRFPLSEDRNYPFEQLNKTFDCLIEMLAETLAKPS